MLQPRVGVAWDVSGNGQLGRARQRGRLLRAAEHAEPGRLGDDQRPAAADDLREHRQPHRQFGAPTPAWPGVVTPDAAAGGRVPAVQRRPRLRPRLQEPAHLLRSTSPTSRSSRRTGRATSTSSGPRARNLTRFLNYNRSGPVVLRRRAGHRQRLRLHRHAAGAAARRGDGDQQPRRVALPRPDARHPQALLERATSSKATTCWPRTRTTTRTSAIRSPIAASTSSTSTQDWGPSDRDIRHKVNFFGYFAMPGGFELNTRVQDRSAQPITASPRSLNGVDRGRNGERKDNEFFTFDWRLARPFRFGARLRADADRRDVQHVQQRQQHQPAEHAGALQLRRLPAHRRRRSAAGAAGGEVRVLGGRAASSARSVHVARSRCSLASTGQPDNRTTGRPRPPNSCSTASAPTTRPLPACCRPGSGCRGRRPGRRR